jgi:hypothetical protein
MTSCIDQDFQNDDDSIMSSALHHHPPHSHDAGTRIEAVAERLEHYARRGVFRGFSQLPDAPQGKAVFKLLWHHNRIFEFIFDARNNTMHLPAVLPQVPVDSDLYGAFERFVKSRHANSLPEHRRIDRRRAQVRSANEDGEVSLTLRIKNCDDEYGTSKLIHLVNEIFLTFLPDQHYEYLVEAFDLDPDRI